MDNMFYNCTSLTSLNLLSFKTGKDLRRSVGMFQDCHKLISIDFSNLEISPWHMSSMFKNCYSLESIKFPKLNTDEVNTLFLIS